MAIARASGIWVVGQVEVEPAAAERRRGDREPLERRGQRGGDQEAGHAGDHGDQQEERGDRADVAADDVADHRRGLADGDRAVAVDASAVAEMSSSGSSAPS